MANYPPYPIKRDAYMSLRWRMQGESGASSLKGIGITGGTLRSLRKRRGHAKGSDRQSLAHGHARLPISIQFKGLTNITGKLSEPHMEPTDLSTCDSMFPIGTAANHGAPQPLYPRTMTTLSDVAMENHVIC